MKKEHVTYAELGEYLTETCSESDRTRIGGHIETCPSCKKALGLFEQSLQPYRKSKVKLPAALKKRVMETHGFIIAEGEGVMGPAEEIRGRKLGWLIIYPGLAVAILLVVLLFLFRGGEQIVLPLSSIRGDAEINGSPLLGIALAGRGDWIVLDAGAEALLAVQEGCLIGIHEDTQLLIDRAARPHVGSANFDITLKNGSIYVIWKGSAMDYTIRTPEGLIRSKGTEFLLIAGEGRTDLLMKEGEVEIESHQGEKAAARTGEKYSLDKNEKSIIREPLSTEDRRLIRDGSLLIKKSTGKKSDNPGQMKENVKELDRNNIKVKKPETVPEEKTIKPERNSSDSGEVKREIREMKRDSARERRSVRHRQR